MGHLGVDRCHRATFVSQAYHLSDTALKVARHAREGKKKGGDSLESPPNPTSGISNPELI
jgi:hypothetical protein